MISVALYSFVDREQNKIKSPGMSIVQGFENGSQDTRILSSRGADCDPFARSEEGGAGDGICDFDFEELGEARSAKAGVVLRAKNLGAGCLAYSTKVRRHLETGIGM